MRQRYKERWIQRFRKFYQYHWIPLLLGIIGTVVVFGLWQQLLVQEQLHIEKLVEQETATVELELNRALSTRILALGRMASEWRTNGGLSQILWEADAANYLRYLSGSQALERVDPSFQTQWVVEGNDIDRSLALRQQSRRQRTLSIARELRQNLQTRRIVLSQDRKSFLVAVPLFVNDPARIPPVDRFDGFIVGVFQFQSFFDSVLKASPQYQIQIFDRNEVIYSQGTPSTAIQPKIHIVQVYDANWQVRVFPTPELIAKEHSPFPTLILWGGLASAWTLAFIADLGQQAQHQARRTQIANQQLQEEIAHRHQVEASLRKSESTLRSFFNSGAMLMGIVELQGNDILHLSDNQAAASFFNTTPEAMQNRFASELGVPPSHLQQWLDRYREAERVQSPVRFEYPHETLTEQRWLAASVCQITTSDSQYPRFSYIVEDITERKQVEAALQQSETKFRQLAENIYSVFWMSDPKARQVLYVSPAYEAIWGRRCEDLYQDFSNWIDTIHPDDRERIRQAQIDNVFQGTYDREYRIIRPDGSMRWIHDRGFPIRDQSLEVRRIAGIAEDITAQKQTESELRELSKALEKELLRSQILFDTTIDGIVVMNHQGDVVRTSPSFAQMIGYTLEETLRLNVADWDAQWTREELRQIRESEVFSPLFETRHRRKDGSLYDVEMSYSRVQLDGEMTHFCICRDITDRKQAEIALRQSEATKQAIIQAIPDVLIRLRADGREVEFISENPFSTIPSDRKRLNTHLYEGLPSQLAKLGRSYIQKALELGTIQEYEQEICLGHKRHYEEVRIVPLLQDEVLVMVRDITERKQTELCLQQAIEAAEAANQSKSIFLANMSHELRTPLNVILGFAQVMLHDPSLTPDQKEELQTIRRSGDYLLSLINDVLDLSKIEAGRCILEEVGFDLIALLDTLRVMMTERANARGLLLAFDIASEVPQFAIADEQKLRQILLNLLSNAIKFTNQGSVTLRVGLMQTQAPRRSFVPSQSSTDPILLRFEVIDTGVGIAPEEQNLIFDAFVQAEAGKTSANGTGLGLTISRKLLELMDGSLSVQSTLGGGSTFTCMVPVLPTCSIEVKPEQETRVVMGLVPGQPHRRVLVVDDRPENRLLMVRLLSPLGLEVREATNGREAIQQWQEWQPDLIWMDLRMPVLGGCEATQQIRTMEQGKASIIIALTAQASSHDRALALAAGCNDYISKPFREETVYQKMAEYLGLEYVYAEANDCPKGSSLNESDLSIPIDPTLIAHLPPNWLPSLEDAAISGNDRAIAELVVQLPVELASIGHYLTDRADKFQFEQILAWLDRYLPDRTP